MSPERRRKPRPPLDQGALAELGLRYVERFATTRAKLSAYLERKVRERGWTGDHPPDLAAIADRFAASGYVDDSAFALAKSRALANRGYGPGRLRQALRAAGVAEADSQDARRHAERESVAAALNFARRRKIGPFASVEPDRRLREKAISAMARAGHPFGIIRAIMDLAPGQDVDAESLLETVDWQTRESV